MPSLPLIQQEAVKWQRRISQIANSGLNTQPAQELAKSDLTRVMQGGSALSNDEAQSMIYSAYNQNVLTPTPQAMPNQGGHGTDWNPAHIIGDVGKDLATDVRSFMPGLIHEGADIINPQKWDELTTQLGQFKFGSISGMAKEVQALPIIGKLIPGMFALSAGTSGFTQHPLNFLLDVVSVADLGSTELSKLGVLGDAAEPGTAMAALQNGHPVEAVARATGMESRMLKGLAHVAPDSPWWAQSTWNNYNALARVYTRRLRDEALTKLSSIAGADGKTIGKMSLDDRAKVTQDARDFNDRYLTQAQRITPELISASGGDIKALAQNISGDAVAYSVMGGATGQAGSVFFTKDQALKYVSDTYGPAVADAIKRGDKNTENFINEVRVDPRKLDDSRDEATKADGGYQANDIIPNKFYPADYAQLLQSVRDFSQKWDWKNYVATEGKENIVVPDPVTGETKVYPTDSLPVKEQSRLHAAAKDLTVAQSRRDSILNEVKRWEDVSAGRAQAASRRERASSEATRAAANSTASILKRARQRSQEAQQAYTDAQSRHISAQDAFNKAIMQDPGERWYPLENQAVKARLKEEAGVKMMKDSRTLAHTIQGTGISAGLQQVFDEYHDLVVKIDATTTREDLAHIVGDDTLKRVEQATVQDWGQMVAAGYDPIWVHHISTDWYDRKTFGNIYPLAHGITHATREKIFSYDPGVLDIHAQLTYQAMEYMREESTKQFNDFLANTGIAFKKADYDKEMLKRYKDTPLLNRDLHQQYVPWKNPADPNEDWLIPKAVKKGLDQLWEGDKLPLKTTRHEAHRIFKVAVLTGPRHFVHVTLGGLVQVMLGPTTAVTELAHAGALIKMIRQGVVPDFMEKHHNEVEDAMKSGRLFKGQYEENVTQFWAYRSGKWAGEETRRQKALSGVHKVESMLNNFENTISDMYRSAVYLDKLKHGGSNEQALALANKVLVDVDNLSPFEKTTLRQFFPFWTYTKHILRYVLTYPADHPLRATILAQLAQNVEQTGKSGDPSRLSKLFFLGDPSPSGNVSTLDFSNLNPFRSMSSAFSMAGFLQGMAPELQIATTAFGINTLTGSPSLHQNFSYDPYTGTNKTSRPSLNVFDFASTFVPETDVLDHFLLFTDSMRQLKQNNPEAYARSFWQELNMPFAIAPINIYDVRAKAAAAQFRDASTAVSNALNTGNTRELRNFVAVPFEGYLFPANEVANYIDNWDKLYPNFAPRAVMRKPKLPKVRTTA